MASADPETEALMDRAQQGDAAAIADLFARHRRRLRQMVAVRLDRRLAARVDPSDVVQEALAEAFRRLPAYLGDRPLPFYPWLRQIAWERLVDLHRRHVRAKRRTVKQEQPWQPALPDQSAWDLAEQLAASDPSAGQRLLQQELRERVHTALASLAEGDREVLVLRHLEHLQLPEMAAVLGVTTAAVQSRYRRAVERLHRLLRNYGENQ